MFIVRQASSANTLETLLNSYKADYDPIKFFYDTECQEYTVVFRLHDIAVERLEPIPFTEP